MSTSTACDTLATGRPPWRPSLVPGIRYQKADDEAILLDRRNRRVHQLDRAGASILRYCDGNHAVEDIVEQLLDEYEVGPDKLSADVLNFLQDLQALEILK